MQGQTRPEGPSLVEYCPVDLALCTQIALARSSSTGACGACTSNSVGLASSGAAGASHKACTSAVRRCMIRAGVQGVLKGLFLKTEDAAIAAESNRRCLSLSWYLHPHKARKPLAA